jgi:hypothetical protein
MRYSTGKAAWRCIAWFVLASSIAVAGEPPPEPEHGPVLIGYLHHESSGLLAEEATRRLDPESDEFDQALYSRLLGPIGAKPLVRFTELPRYLWIPENSPRWFLQRYIVLEYPLPALTPELIEQLRATGLFGYLDETRLGGWSLVPNDPYYPPNAQSTAAIPAAYRSQQWFFNQMNFPAAWDITTGHALVGLMDTGITMDHPDLVPNFRPNLSWAFEQVGNGSDSVHDWGGHGTHTSGLLAAKGNSSPAVGSTGACWNCGIAMAQLASFEDFLRVDAATYLAQSGVTLINFSGFLELGAQTNCPPPELEDALPSEYLQLMANAHPLCPALELAWQRNAAFIASSGNDKAAINFPARAPTVIAAGGTESTGQIWDSANDEGCPSMPPGYPPNTECGSNTGAEQDFIAAAKHVLSTFLHGSTWFNLLKCNDEVSIAGFSPLGYDYCTGTSMSAPLVSGAVALIRSAHPNLSPTLVEEALRKTASGGGNHNNTMGYGIPHVGNAVKAALGKSNGVQLQNRLAPMFALYHATTTSYLFTSKPQVAAAAITNTLYVSPAENPSGSYAYTSPASLAPSIEHYFEYPMEVRSDNLDMTRPRVAFWLFTTAKNPFAATPLVPLYRLAMDPYLSYNFCIGQKRDHGYAINQTGIDYFTQTDFCPFNDFKMKLQGIEGYLLPSCPPGFTCLPQNRHLEGGLQCVYLRKRAGTTNPEDWALLLHDQLPGNPGTPFPNHTQSAPNMSGCLGYVFTEMHSDGDYLIDGIEFLLGTDRNDTNSDTDCLSDAQEYPPFGLPDSDPRLYTAPGSGSCDVIFADDFE